MPYYTPSQLQNTQLHFIIGPHRSGTTLLTSILNAHPQILSTPEFRFVLHFMNPYGKQKPVSPAFAKILINISLKSSNKKNPKTSGL